MKVFKIDDTSCGICFDVHYRTGNYKNINIRVNGSGVVTVSANRRTDFDRVYDFVWSKRKWIYRNLQRVVTRQNNFADVMRGECLYLSGKKIPVSVKKGKGNKVVLSDETAQVTVRNTDISYVAKVILKWYGQLTYVQRIFDRCVERCTFIAHVPHLSMRISKNRLGTCYPSQNKIVLNSLLAAGEEHLAETVCLHELCHLIYSGHNKNFYTLLQKVQPDYKKYQKQAKEFFPSYYNALMQCGQ